MGYFLILLLIIFLCWPWISKWLGGWFSKFMARRTEDMMRRMMGMPPLKEEERRRRKAQKEASASSHSSRRRHRPATEDAAGMMKSVAEDVEFTEIHEFESTTITENDPRTGTRRVYREEQVTDAEFVEIKDKTSFHKS